MNNDIYSIASELKKILEDDSRLKLLNDLEQQMNDNEEVMALAYQKDIASAEYSDALSHFREDDDITIKARQQLYRSKKNLDEHPLVRQYLKAYSEVRNLYLEINNILFGDLSMHMKEHH
ncbi:MAG: YlbF family regulator [Erysipelotrichaceae bacterium]|nr:YlbF family regulator [Erysipelotrichaceae bacterium]